VAELIRKKVRWKTKKRKGGSRVWKWGWVTVKTSPSKKGARSGEKKP
jgi:hypothetical protein